MPDAIRKLADAIDALFDVVDVIAHVERDLGLEVETAAIELYGVLALMGSVEW